VASSNKTASEARFERYLIEHGYRFEHHPSMSITKRPDYLFERGSEQAVCEVKEFRTRRISERLSHMGGTAVMSPKDVFGAVRNAVDDAAAQLKPLAGKNLALVVLLANPHVADVMLDVDHVVWALYGNPGWRIAVHRESGETEPGQHFAGGDGALTAKHAYVSAVVTLHEREFEQDWADAKVKEFEDPWDFLRYAAEARECGEVPEGNRRWVEVIHTISAAEGGAVALPDSLFDGPDDHVWALNEDAAYERRR